MYVVNIYKKSLKSIYIYLETEKYSTQYMLCTGPFPTQLSFPNKQIPKDLSAL